MPRGVPASGFRKPRTKKADKAKVTAVPQVVESDAEIFQRITERFEVLELMTEAATCGDVTSLIVSGPAGLGKSHTVEEALRDWDPRAQSAVMVIQHTPGPWQNNGVDLVDGGPRFGAQLFTTQCGEPISDGEMYANALLMAASPELLDACNTAAEVLSDMGLASNDPALVKLLAAIAKATGAA